MDGTRQKPIAVLGAGSWGTALALHLARNGNEVRLWTVETDHVPEMAAERTNRRYMPGYPFPDSLHVFSDLAETISTVDDILVAVPSVGFRDTLTMLKPLLKPNMRILWATKGLDLEGGKLLHDIALEILGDKIPLAVLSGPSFAKEVAAALPTAVVIASHDQAFAKELLSRFNSPRFRIYLSTDIAGLEVGGVVKNVMAVATGISDGMGFGANARCALIARGLAEMMRLGTALGAKPETITGLAGLGDLVLTCTDDQSRNRRFGLALGRGQDIAAAEREIGQVVEGKRNAELVLQLAQQHKVEMPIAEMVWNILQGKSSPSDAMKNLLTRETKSEIN
jgi:glycerol-3-phosphate dehydrogenase (NAD(P)+)